MRAFADALLSVLLAAPCVSCGEVLDQPTRGPVCFRCWQSIPALTPPLCERCGDPLPAWRTIVPSGRCSRCRRAPGVIECARAIGPYEGTLRTIIHALKYDGRRSLAVPLASLMRERAADILEGVSATVPVPLHSSRRRERGFNQAVDLARGLGLPVSIALRRTRATETQAGLPAAQRHRNVRGAFSTTKAAGLLTGRVVLLVDDVSTTGATLEACARALRADGIVAVRALTAARVVSEGAASPR